MSKSENVDYGPLAELIGVWEGNKGVDIAPEPNGKETNPYFESITFSTAGNVTNAEEQQSRVEKRWPYQAPGTNRRDTRLIAEII